MTDDLIEAAEMGEVVREFIQSPLGLKMIDLAIAGVIAAQEELESVDPENTIAIRKLQNDAKLGRMFEGWLKELVSRGDNALQVFKQQESA